MLAVHGKRRIALKTHHVLEHLTLLCAHHRVAHHRTIRINANVLRAGQVHAVSLVPSQLIQGLRSKEIDHGFDVYSGKVLPLLWRHILKVHFNFVHILWRGLREHLVRQSTDVFIILRGKCVKVIGKGYTVCRTGLSSRLLQKSL